MYFVGKRVKGVLGDGVRGGVLVCWGAFCVCLGRLCGLLFCVGCVPNAKYK